MDVLLDHYRSPTHRGRLPGARVGKATNPLCGDEVEVFARVGPDGRIDEARFDGVGCMISQGGADVLCGAWAGKTIEEAANMELAQVLRILGTTVSPSRQRCAMLPVVALGAATAK